MKSKLLPLVFFPVLFSACNVGFDTSKEQSIVPDSFVLSRQSFANPDEVRLDSLFLNLSVDFEKQALSGSAKWYLTQMAGTDTISLDIRTMAVEKVLVDGKEADWVLSREHPIYGQGLSIPVKKESRELEVFYHTLPGAQALQWMQPGQTAGGKPFLYTQSQAILARSWVPCMDVPQMRFTYRARVQCDPQYLALMSASNPVVKNDSGIYHFSMPQAIPSYLMALAVGDIAYKKYDETCGVYAELPVLEKAYAELEDLPAMINAAEKLYGPYRWGKYDVLFLPPSFPFGGMENPRLTFANPTILAGDKSLVALVAHELAHSWSGNLVTNRTWNDFWLNEGFTVYFEQRIMEAVYGKDYADMLTVLGYGDLSHTMEDFGPEHPDTRLMLDLTGRDPDEGVSDIAYEKGRFFLRHLENIVGRPRFDAFVKAYFEDHAFQTMDTKGFIDYLNKNLLDKNPAWKKAADIDTWIYKPGLPTTLVVPEAKSFKEVDALSTALIRLDRVAITKTEHWTTHHWLHFIRGLKGNRDTVVLTAIDRKFGFSTSNAEITFAWLMVAVDADMRSSAPRIRSFLVEVGRRKFLTPLYEAMSGKNAFWKAEAASIYEQARPGYHSVSVHTLDPILSYRP